MKKKTTGKKKQKKSIGSAGEAGLAFKHGFYLETIWILSVLIEKKNKNLLKRLEHAQHVQAYTFEQSIKRIKYHHLSQKLPELVMNLSIELVDEMRNWKNSRNTMLKDMVHVHVSKNRMERLALEGIALYKNWSKSLKQVKTAIKKGMGPAGQKEKSQVNEANQ